MTRRERIAAVLAEHPEGLSTPQIAELSGEDMANRRRARQNSWLMLQDMETRGEVARVPTTGQEAEWRLVPARLRPLCSAIGRATATWKSLPVQEWAALGITEEAWQESIGHYQAAIQRKLAD
jgi:hypothetical protein